MNKPDDIFVALKKMLLEQTYNGKKRSEKDIDMFLAHAKIKAATCLICKNPSAGVAIFVANKESAAEYGAEPGKARQIFYGLCEEHIQPGEIPEVEEELLRQSAMLAMAHQPGERH